MNSLKVATRLKLLIAHGDLTQDVRLDGTNEVTQLVHSMLAMREALVAVVSNVCQGSDAVATASSEIAQGNHDLSARLAQACARQVCPAHGCHSGRCRRGRRRLGKPSSRLQLPGVLNRHIR